MIRTECQGDLNTWNQEYPLVPEVAFISTGRNVFSQRHLNVCYEPTPAHKGRLVRDGARVRFAKDEGGDLTIYQGPSSRRDYGVYMIGADASREAFGDYSVAQVVNRVTLEQVAVYRSKHIHPLGFAEELIKLGEFYNQAMLAPETNMSGSEVTGILKREYPNIFLHQKTNSVRGQPASSYGWLTNTQTKAEAVGNLQSLVIFTGEDPDSNTFRIRDHQTFMEMRNFITTANGGYTNGVNENHDDTVMAMAIAVTAVVLTRAEMYSDTGFAQDRWTAAAPVPRDVAAAQAAMRTQGAVYAPELVEKPGGGLAVSQPGPDDRWLWNKEEPDMYEESEW
jgi:phage terminase large subunit